MEGIEEGESSEGEYQEEVEEPEQPVVHQKKSAKENTEAAILITPASPKKKKARKSDAVDHGGELKKSKHDKLVVEKDKKKEVKKVAKAEKPQIVLAEKKKGKPEKLKEAEISKKNKKTPPQKVHKEKETKVLIKVDKNLFTKPKKEALVESSSSSDSESDDDEDLVRKLKKESERISKDGNIKQPRGPARPYRRLDQEKLEERLAALLKRLNTNILKANNAKRFYKEYLREAKIRKRQAETDQTRVESDGSSSAEDHSDGSSGEEVPAEKL